MPNEDSPHLSRLKVFNIAGQQGWNDQTLLDLALDWIVAEKDRRRHFIIHLQRKQMDENFQTDPDMSEKHTLCAHCDHFIEENSDYDPGSDLCGWLHMDDGDQEYDHDAEPGVTKTMGEWDKSRPDLTKEYPDGNIGPNSIHHSRRGKIDSH